MPGSRTANDGFMLQDRRDLLEHAGMKHEGPLSFHRSGPR